MWFSWFSRHADVLAPLRQCTTDQKTLQDILDGANILVVLKKMGEMLYPCWRN